jgi:transposase InsO family protein
MIISETGVYHVLKRANLDRLFYAWEHSDNPIINERYLREVEKKKVTHIESSHPGDHIFQDIFYVGTIKRLGRIYQQAGVYAYGSFGFAKVYTNKKYDNAIDFVKTKVIPVYEMFHIPLDRILTNNGKEYTTHWKNDKHAYEIFLKIQGIRHTKIKPRCPKSNGMAERFNCTLLEEFYQIAMIKKVCTSLGQLQDDLDQFIHYYNFKRTHQGYG